MRRFLSKVGIWACLCFLVSLVASPASYSDNPELQIIRVLVAENQEKLTLTVNGSYTIRALPSLQILEEGRNIEDAALKPSQNGIHFAQKNWPAQGIRIETLGEKDLRLNQSQFRGTLDILKNKNNKLYVINRAFLEDYLYGVLPHEVAFWWPMQALKAQAIAARTYATYQMSVSQKHKYDVKNSTSSQVYGGAAGERHRTNTAVDLTQGQVLSYQGKIFPAYFHATCGGVTAGAVELWKIDLPPIAGGVHCDSCQISPHFRWQKRIPLSFIEQRLKKYYKPVGQILNIEPVSQTPSGRAGRLSIKGTEGRITVAAKDFRIWLGGDKMRSTAFKVRLVEDVAIFDGKGWGHGVGLCQWGALGRAFLGEPSNDILQFYYPGSEIKNNDSL